MSGRPHACQSSSTASFGTNKSWIASINNMFSLGIAGWLEARFNGVRFNVCNAERCACQASRMALQKARSGQKTRSREEQSKPTPGSVQNDRGEAGIAAGRQPRQPSAQRKAPKRHGRATFPQEPPGQGANFSHRLSHRLGKLQVIRTAQRPGLTRTAPEVIRRLQRGRVEARPMAAAGNQRISKAMIDEVNPSAMKQNDGRPFLPALGAAVEPAMNDVILREAARSRRRKAEVQARVAGLNSSRAGWVSAGMKSGPCSN